MAPRTGDLGKLTEKRRGNRAALLGEGSQGKPLGREAGAQAPHAGPANAAARRRARRARPRAPGWAHRLGPGGPSGRPGEIRGRARRAPGSSDSGGRAARGPRVRGAALRASPPASSSSSAPRKRETPSDPPAPAGRKVTSVGQGARERGGVGTGSAHVLRAVRRRRGRGEEAADRAAPPRLPAPLAGGSRLGGAAAGHTPREARRGPRRPDSECGLRGREGHRGT